MLDAMNKQTNKQTNKNWPDNNINSTCCINLQPLNAADLGPVWYENKEV